MSLLLGGSAMIFGLAAFGWLVLRARRTLEARKIRARQRRGMAGQRRGRVLLQRRGYRILAEEHPLSAKMIIDDQVYSYGVRIDFIVQKGRRTYGVEVKTGEQATNPLHRQTRRQLLEYSQLLAVDGLLLLDMEAEELMRSVSPPRDGAPGACCCCCWGSWWGPLSQRCCWGTWALAASIDGLHQEPRGTDQEPCNHRTGLPSRAFCRWCSMRLRVWRSSRIFWKEPEGSGSQRARCSRNSRRIMVVRTEE